MNKEEINTMTTEELVEKYKELFGVFSKIIKDAELIWLHELQWYVDEMEVVANELETRGIEVEHKWWWE